MRVISWFSCGIPSACAAKLAIEKYGKENVIVAYCDTLTSEHKDNVRFFNDIQIWLGVKILKLKSKKYEDIDDVFIKTRYMSGIYGARCTTEMKKTVRHSFERIDDIHIFGMTLEEAKRAKRFEENNFELKLDWLLIDNKFTRYDCHQMIEKAGIKQPAMYELGFKNNNCIGCVKSASAAYWNKIRKLFPDIFLKRCEQSRLLNVKLVKVKGERIFLDELEESENEDLKEDLSCGVLCQPSLF